MLYSLRCPKYIWKIDVMHYLMCNMDNNFTPSFILTSLDFKIKLLT